MSFSSFKVLRALISLACVLVAPLSHSAAQSDVPPRPTPLATLLNQQHYVEVALGHGKTGYFDVTAEAQGKPLLLYLDSGSTGNQIEDAIAERLKLPKVRAASGIIAVKETEAPNLVVLESLTLGGIQSRVEAVVNSQASANQGRRNNGEQPYDGVLGASFLHRSAAIIDYGSGKLFLHDSAHRPTPAAVAERTQLLRDAGYVELPLTVRANGQQDIVCEINGQAALLLVDTGAQSTSVDRAFADRLKVPQYEKTGSKVRLLDGSESQLRVAKIEKLALGTIPLKLETILLPMDRLNEWRKGEGYPPWSGLLGAEILNGLGAVIDFGAGKLFLLDKNRKRP